MLKINRHYYKKLFLSYMILVLASFISLIYSYQLFTKRVKQDVAQLHHQYLHGIRTTLDSCIEDLNDLSFMISSTPALNGTLIRNRNVTSSDRMDLYKISKYLRDITVTNHMINNVYVYFNKANAFITNNGNYLSHQYIITRDVFGEDEIGFRQRYNKNYASQLLYIDKNTEGVGNRLLYAQSLPINGTAHDTIIFFEINTKPIIDDLEVNEEKLWTIMYNDQVIYHVGNKNYMISTKDTSLHEKGYAIKEDDSIRVFSLESNVSKYRYVEAISTKKYLKPLKQYELFMRIVFLLILGIGIYLSYYFSKKNYVPIQDILNMVTKEEKNSVKDEIGYIKKTLNENNNKYKHMKNSHNNQVNRIRELLLLQCIKAPMNDKTLISQVFNEDEELSDIGSYYLLIIHINDDECANIYEDYREQRLNFFIIDNIYKEVLEDQYIRFITMKDHDKLIGVLDLGECSLEREAFENKMLHINELLKSHFELGVKVAISNEHSEIFAVTKAYNEAIETMHYSKIFESNMVLFYQDIQDNKKIYNYSLDSQHRLINYINEGNYKGSKAIIEDTISNHIMSKNISIAAIECLVLEVLCTIIKTINSKEEESIFESSEPIRKIQDVHNIYEKIDVVLLFAENICHIKEKMINKQSEISIYEQVNHFIVENYSDSNLNIAMIAEHFHVSPTRLSKLYKKESNENIIDMINKIRIQNAKHIIRSQSIPIRAVASQVGYDYSNSFIRTFKKYEGITPGKFKERVTQRIE